MDQFILELGEIFDIKGLEQLSVEAQMAAIVDAAHLHHAFMLVAAQTEDESKLQLDNRLLRAQKQQHLAQLRAQEISHKACVTRLQEEKRRAYRFARELVALINPQLISNEMRSVLGIQQVEK